MKKIPVVLIALTVFLLLEWSPGALAEQGYRIIVHPDNPTNTISKKKVSRLLLKEISRWEHGVAAQPMDLGSNSPVREALSRNVHGRSAAARITGNARSFPARSPLLLKSVVMLRSSPLSSRIRVASATYPPRLRLTASKYSV